LDDILSFIDFFLTKIFYLFQKILIGQNTKNPKDNSNFKDMLF